MAAALAIHLTLYCAVAGCFALALYYLMQPTRLPNPGLAAHKPSPVAANYLELLRSEREAAQRAVKAAQHAVKVERAPEPTGSAARQAAEAEPKPKKAQTATQSRTRPASRPQSPGTHYAQQPSFGGYTPMY
jgi:hypothetical protein